VALRFLLNNNALADLHDNNGATALIMAAQEGHGAILRALPEAWVKVYLQTLNGNTAPVLASLKGKLEVVEMLLDNGAQIDLTTPTGATALFAAASRVIAKLSACHLTMVPTLNCKINMEDLPSTIQRIMR